MNEFLRVAFKHINPQQVLDGSIWYNTFGLEDFKKIMRVYITRYNETELENMYYYLKDISDSNELNVFLILFFCTDLMMTVQNNTVCCRYKNLMRWRMSTFELGEELFTTSYLAQKCGPEEMSRIGFSWKFVLGHDNYYLNKLLKNGLAENHFHLYGSAPIFPVSWVSMMNDMYNSEFYRNLEMFDAKRRGFHISYSVDYQEKPLAVLCRQAALIRLMLYALITKEEIKVGSYWMRYEEYCHYLTGEGAETFSGSEELPNLYDHMEKGAYWRIYWERTIENVLMILRNPVLLEEHKQEIQSSIELLKKGSRADYALKGLKQYQIDWKDQTNKNSFFAGERWLMYEMFRRILRGKNRKNVYEYNLFYAYILLKNHLFEELVQANDSVGFENFQIYQGRKVSIWNRNMFEESIRQAVRDCVVSHQLSSLEARIVPKKSADEYAECIWKLDHIIDPKGDNRNNYFYVFHFLKKKDNFSGESKIVECRHNQYRKEIKKQAEALIMFRRQYPELAQRVLGMDAAGKEIGCRPEVFATVFRFLSSDVGGEYAKNRPTLPQLRLTYHVGEEFLDIVDGMRAIEEAVRFLNLRCGDRIGHAVALGIDPLKWYERKKNLLMIPQQDYLDNIVWLYKKMIILDLGANDGLKEWLEGEFDTFFRKIYLSHMDDNELRIIMTRYLSYNKSKDNQRAFESFPSQFVFDIHTYYKAWEIRGDNPEFYQMGYFEEITESEDQYRKSGVNRSWPKTYNNRYIPEVGIINYFYHYNRKVREEGNKILRYEVKPAYVRAVKSVQEKMQYWIGKKGIGIETNPSSNFKITSIERYEEHPITTFYNKGLTTDEKSLKACPQLNVSINTDDQGIFVTSLENEYSLMAYALEHKCDEKGKELYAREMIYDWLANVKQMGNKQSFGGNANVYHDQREFKNTMEKEDHNDRKMSMELK